MKSIVRKIIPRHIRNVIRSPTQTIQWWFNQYRKPVRLDIRKDFTILCPRNAVKTGYSHFLNDPEQIQELNHFITTIANLNPPRLLDIGCHYGIFCMAALHYGGPEARVLGVDASEVAGNMFRESLQCNNWSSSGEFIHTAVGQKEGSIQLVETGVSGGNYFVQPEDHPQSELTETPMATIDLLVARLSWNPNIIKIDVEGFEREVILGGSNFLGNSNPVLCLELHNQIMKDHDIDPSTVIHILRDLGYQEFYSIEDRPLSESDILSKSLLRFAATKR